MANDPNAARIEVCGCAITLSASAKTAGMTIAARAALFSAERSATAVDDTCRGLGDGGRRELAPDGGRHLGAEELDRAHDLLVRHRPDAELDEEAVVVEELVLEE